MILMNIQLIYFDACPSWQAGLNILETALQELQIDVPIELIEVLDDADAARLKFAGSPSFWVDGRDLWYEQRENYSLSCRVYSTPAGIRGIPTVFMLKEKLRLKG
jgi:hypothetical protein